MIDSSAQAGSIVLINPRPKSSLKWAAIVFVSIGMSGCADSATSTDTSERQTTSKQAESASANDASEKPTSVATPQAPQEPNTPSDAAVSTLKSTSEDLQPVTIEREDAADAVASDAVDSDAVTPIGDQSRATRVRGASRTSPTQQVASKPVAAIVAGESAPGDSYQAARLLDMRDVSPFKLEQLATHVPLELDYTCASDAGSALKYHQDLLQESGWDLLDSGGAYDTGNYRSRFFQKDDYIVQLAISEFSKQLAGASLRHLGNVDARELPMVENATQDESSTAWGAMYKSDCSVEEVTQFCRRMMAQQGWMEYKSTASASELPYESGGARVIPFVQNGVTCYLNISPPGLFTGRQTSPSYFLTGLVAKGMSVPEGAKRVELDRKLGNLSYGLDLPLAEAVAQTESPMQKMGWEDQAMLRRVNARQAELVYRADDETLFVAEFSESGFSNTQVRIRSIDAASLDVMLADRTVSADAADTTLGTSSTNVRPEPELGDESTDRMAEESNSTEVVTDNALASKAANTTTAEATLGSTTVNLNFGVAYQTRRDGQLETTVLLTDSELPKQELLLQLSELSEISLFDLNGPIPQFIEVSWDEDFKSCSLNIAGASVSGFGDELDIDVEANQGWIRGSISLPQPRQVFDDKLTFTATFDLAALSPLDLTPEMLADSQRALQEIDGVPLPADAEESYRESSRYSTTSHAVVELGLAEVIELYRTEMPSLGWKEVEDASQQSSTSADLGFVGSDAAIEVHAQPTDEAVALTIVRREVTQARKDQILPAKGKGKLFFGNAFEKEVVVAISGRDYKLKAGLGTDDPKKALSYDVAPGKYKLTIKVPGKAAQEEVVQVKQGTTWGIMILPSGDHFADRLF